MMLIGFVTNTGELKTSESIAFHEHARRFVTYHKSALLLALGVLKINAIFWEYSGSRTNHMYFDVLD